MTGTANRPAGWIRVSAALTLSLAVLSVGAGTAGAATTPAGADSPSVSSGAAPAGPKLPGQTGRLYKLVNGWD